jgi:hypothetical protein
MARKFSDLEAFCRGLDIRHKDGTTTAMNWWPSQAKLAAAIRKQEQAGKPVRVVGLKSRRVGWSALASAYLFRKTAFLPGQSSWVFAHVHSSCQDIFGYYDGFDQSYRGEIQKVPTTRKLKPSQSSPGRLEFGAQPGGSYIQTATAGNVDVGRSTSIRHLVLDEYAFYRDAPSLSTGVLQCVPEDPDTTIIVLSTANGVGGPFYDLWRRTVEGSTDWVAVFFAWWEHHEYQRAFSDPLEASRFQDTLTREEGDLQKLHNLTLEQLHWRRWAIANKCEGSTTRFHQEYPSTPEEAFITSGRPRFDLSVLARQPIIREPLVGELTRQRIGVREIPVFGPRADGLGAMRLFKRPAEGHGYVLGADPSQGIDVGEETGTSDPDFSVACVLDADTGEQVAVVRERFTPTVFGEYVCALAEWYNWAFVVPEAVDPSLVQEILRFQYPIGKVYVRHRLADERALPSLQHVGFKTTTIARQQLISGLERALFDNSVFLHDAVTQQELHTFVYKANGRVEHQTGCHDDCVIALALAVVGLEATPRVVPPKRTQPIVRYGRTGCKRGQFGR